jgi:hypothetical protein
MRATIIVLAGVLAVALTGGAFAAATIDGGDVKNNSLTGKDVRNKSLTRADFRGSVRGPRGLPGPAGPQGPAGPTIIGQMTTVASPQAFFGPTDLVMAAIAFCPAGQRVVSGGGASVTDEQLAITAPTDGRTGWFVVGVDLIDDGGEYVQATANCAPAGAAVAARAASRAAERRYVARMVRKVARQQDGSKR